MGIVLGVDKNEETPGKKQDNPHDDPKIRRVIQEKGRAVRQLFVEIEYWQGDQNKALHHRRQGVKRLGVCLG